MITGQPDDQLDIAEGSDVPFIVAATSSLLTFQWQKDEANIAADVAKYSGIDKNHLIVMNVAESDNGQYRCIVSNMVDTATSSEATLLVCK